MVQVDKEHGEHQQHHHPTHAQTKDQEVGRSSQRAEPANTWFVNREGFLTNYNLKTKILYIRMLKAYYNNKGASLKETFYCKKVCLIKIKLKDSKLFSMKCIIMIINQ